MKQHIIVTGGAGFIGSCFVRLAVECGYHVVVLDALTYAGHRENIAGIKETTLVVGDIRDHALSQSLLQKYQPVALFNFAAESHVDNSIARSQDFISTNIDGAYQLLEAVRAHLAGISSENARAFRFLQVSTDEVFGALGETGYFSESTPYAPNSPYSASKAAADHLVRAWHHTYGIPTLITHCTNNYGPRQLPEKLIPVIITRAVAAKPLPVYGDGKHVRDWIHVEDHCRGIMLAWQKGKIGEHYCFGGNAEKQNLDLVHVLCDILDELRPRSQGSYRELVTFVSDRPGHDRRYAMDDSKSEKELGFARNWTFETGMRATVEWYLQNTAWAETVMSNRGSCAA